MPKHNTGKERDSETGLDYFGARYNSSNLGRFMSPDWAARAESVPYAKIGNPQSLNLYTYTLNNPVSNVDADGHADGPATKCGEGKNYCNVAENPTPTTTQNGPDDQELRSEPRSIRSELFASIVLVDDYSGGGGSGGPLAIFYDKGVPPMSEAVKNYVEKVAAGNDSVNISATTNGEHAPNSNHYNGTAVDINKIDAQPIRNSETNPEVARHVQGLQESANSPTNGVAHENYGPAGLWRDGRTINNASLQAQHENHIHITIPRDDQ
jgi:RHS repeat-associated protein